MLTPRQKQIFEYIKKYIKDKKYSPSLEEIAKRFRLTKSTIHQHLRSLEKEGHISKTKNRYSYRKDLFLIFRKEER